MTSATLSLVELFEIFPDETASRTWFEKHHWPNGRFCPHCGSVGTAEVPDNKPMPYWCGDCRSYFSVRTGSALANSRVPLRKWAIAVWLYITRPKGISSVQLAKDIEVSQRTAWFMLHRLRETWKSTGLPPFQGPVEVDETYLGGKRKNMHGKKRRQLRGRGGHGKTIVIGARDRASNTVSALVIDVADRPTLQGFIRNRVAAGATVYTDSARAYRRMPGYRHDAVNHTIGEYVRGPVHTNGVENAWSQLKRIYHGTHHWWSAKHMQRYVSESAGRHNIRHLGALERMARVVTGLIGKRLTWNDLVRGRPRTGQMAFAFPVV